MAHPVFGALFIVFRIVGAGVGVVVTQALGAGQRLRADAVARAVLGAATWIGGAVAATAALCRQPLLELLNTPPDITPLAALFLLALAPAMLLDAWNASMTAVLRAHLRARETLAVMVLMQLTHLLLMAPLMLGWGPLPALGLVGYALAMIATRALALIATRALALMLHLWLWRTRLHLTPRWADAWRLPRAELADVARIGVPGAAENGAYRLAFMASVAALGTLGAAALATHAYAQQLIMVVLLFGLATGLSVEVLVGHLVGAGSMLLVLAGGSWLLGVHLGLGLVGVWIAYAADEWLRGLLMWRRWQRLAGVPHARASRRRLLQPVAPQQA